MRAVRYTTSMDGTSLAWCRAGSGPSLVKAANWLTHLEYDSSSPVWSHWVEYLESRFSVVRYDERGCGLSDRRTQNLTIDSWVQDLRAVVEASEIDRPFYLMGVSQGAASSIAYAVKYPEDVAGLILVGGYSRGSNHRDEHAAALYKAVVDVFRLGWDEDNPVFQDVFTSRFIPEAPRDERRWFTDLCQNTLSPEIGAKLLMARADVNVEDLLVSVSAPTLVVHAHGDQVVPFAEGQLLAQRIPNARMTVVEGKNHIFQSSEKSWREFCVALDDFANLGKGTAVSRLTSRENEVLRGICEAKSNKEIAAELGLSEKTVRNHTSSILSKLELDNRQQAIREYAGEVGI